MREAPVWDQNVRSLPGPPALVLELADGGTASLLLAGRLETGTPSVFCPFAFPHVEQSFL